MNANLHSSNVGIIMENLKKGFKRQNFRNQKNNIKNSTEGKMTVSSINGVGKTGQQYVVE